MPDTESTAPAATETTTPAAAEPAKPSPSEAGRTLREARDARRAALREGKTDPKGAGTAERSQETKPTSGDSAGASSANSEGKPAAKSTGQEGTSPDANTTEKTAPSDDDIAALVRLDRETKDGAKKLKTERDAFEAEKTKNAERNGRFEKAEAALAAGDPVGALRVLYPGKDLSETALVDLLASMDSPAAAKPADPDELVAKALDKLKAEQAAEAARKDQERRDAETAGARALAEAQGRYLDGVNAVFQKDKDRYPEIVRQFKRLGSKGPAVVSEALLEKTEALRLAGKAVPPARDILDAYEKELRELEGPAASPTVTAAWRSDEGRPAPTDDGPKSLEDIREARRAKLRAPLRTA